MINKELKKLFNNLGITETGVVAAEDANRLILGNESVFGNSAKISEINDILSGAKSIVVFLVPYNSGAEPINLSRYATGEDYHKVCAKISKKISDKLADYGYESVSFADAGPLRERRLAQMAGLGIIGDSGFLINQKYGTYTFIGYIITDCLLPTSQISEGECLKCGKCMKACPGNALNIDSFCIENCISYITQKKGELTNEEKSLIKKGKSAWGCDICQTVCPMNEGKDFSSLPPFNENLILCINNEYLSNREFRKKYDNRAFTWRGKSVIDRNLSILADNTD